eukprot:TRINITY_DN6738_c0_g1_i1.p1 TRINITY_DN6738_c0_g1~~TRINITY_DN6738_c0_g1_i1.p1  ORF type:complete len:258 (+),score=30.48 TRINITY_DN6738_c0_g1_i1:69-776(+)
MTLQISRQSGLVSSMVTDDLAAPNLRKHFNSAAILVLDTNAAIDFIQPRDAKFRQFLISSAAVVGTLTETVHDELGPLCMSQVERDGTIRLDFLLPQFHDINVRRRLPEYVRFLWEHLYAHTERALFDGSNVQKITLPLHMADMHLLLGEHWGWERVNQWIKRTERDIAIVIEFFLIASVAYLNDRQSDLVFVTRNMHLLRSLLASDDVFRHLLPSAYRSHVSFMSPQEVLAKYG